MYLFFFRFFFNFWLFTFHCSVTKLCPALCDRMDCGAPGFPVLHCPPELTQTHVHWVNDAIQPSHLLSSPSPPALSLTQHQGLFQWVGSLDQVAKLLKLQLQHQSFQWISRVDWFPLVSSYSPRHFQESSPAPQFESMDLTFMDPKICFPTGSVMTHLRDEIFQKVSCYLIFPHPGGWSDSDFSPDLWWGTPNSCIENWSLLFSSSWQGSAHSPPLFPANNNRDMAKPLPHGKQWTNNYGIKISQGKAPVWFWLFKTSYSWSFLSCPMAVLRVHFHNVALEEKGLKGNIFSIRKSNTFIPYPSLSPRVCSSPCPSSWWWYPTISSFIAPFSSCPQSFLETVSFPMSQLFISGGQSIGVSTLASVLPVNIQGCFPLALTGLISSP